MSMYSKKQKCSQAPKLSGLTQTFLDVFGTDTLPAGEGSSAGILQTNNFDRYADGFVTQQGAAAFTLTRYIREPSYIENGSYGPKTKNQQFAELFIVFHLLIVLAVLCFIVFLSIIGILTLYFKRRSYKREPCRYSKWLTLLLITLLLLTLILSALSLYHTIMSISDLKKVYEDIDDGGLRITDLEDDLEEVLIKKFNDERNRHIARCENSPHLRDLYPHITTARHLSSKDVEKFKRFNRTIWVNLFKDDLIRNDLFRTFMRQFHRLAESDTRFVRATSSGAYRLKTLTPLDWAEAHKAIDYMTQIIIYFARSAPTDERKQTLCAIIRRYYDDIGDELKNAKHVIEKTVNTLFWRLEDQAKAPYKFGYIACIISAVILAIFLLIILYSCLRRRIGPLVFIFVLLALVFIIMSFVTIYHFSVGVIEYNGLCNKRSVETTNDSFIDDLARKCTGVESIYTLMSYDYMIQPIEELDNMNITELENECKSFCTPLDTGRLDYRLDEKLQHFPDYGFCAVTKYEQPWVNTIINSLQEEPYKLLARKTRCNINLLSKAQNIQPRARQSSICSSCIKLGKDILALLPFIKREASELCKAANEQCDDFRKEVVNSTEEFYAFKELAEDKLRHDLGNCDLILHLSNEKKREFCKCETFILNGVWVGALLFMLFLLIALLLLPCLMWIFMKCSGQNYISESYRGGRGVDAGAADAIVLSPIALPRNVVERLKADHNPRVKIYAQKTENKY